MLVNICNLLCSITQTDHSSHTEPCRAPQASFIGDHVFWKEQEFCLENKARMSLASIQNIQISEQFFAERLLQKEILKTTLRFLK